MTSQKTGILDSISELSLHRVLLHPVALMVVATVVMIVIGSMTWQAHKTEIVQLDEFSITKANLLVPAHPSWVPENWIDVAIRDSRLHEVSILDVNATEMIASALAVQPWVKEIDRVEKTRRTVRVDLKFRQPVAMVEIGGNKLVPVDGEGVILDGNLFTTAQVNSYMRISIPLPAGNSAMIGKPWPDNRIKGCAKIAALWQDHWADLQLLRVVNRSPAKHANKKTSELVPFELFTSNETPIIWGSLPGSETKGEATAEEKIHALIKFSKTQLPLNQLGPGIGLDLRTGQVKKSSMSLTRKFDSQIEQVR